MTERDRRFAWASLLFATLSRGTVAYEFDAPCGGYQMCVTGGTRVCRPTATKLDVALYSVAAGEACALTTQSLLSGERLAARSVAEMETELAVLPSAAFADLMRSSASFRNFVMRDYFGLASKLSLLVENQDPR
ncbi:hypothetical protein [Chenggangzhangella methanolivorans]|uniref:Uncharacterized protein n=2 Tax=Chenggangzhangella methanolivorans TaxID=1437009 RepID=A0A9E6UQK7_9HYPH|nr:hypothetical protein [Chenggangzhangella methanolivorans]QZO01085.1 hypothetical protein K6K41_05770 [Chenggangzhangella methanolivorans]